MTFMQIIFLISAALTLGSAIMVVTTRHLMHAAFWLILSLLGVAILFALLETRFYVVVQVVVYIGAIAILILFAIMLTRQVMQHDERQLNRGWLAAALVSCGLFGGLVAALSSWSFFWVETRTVPAGGENLLQLGNALVDPMGYLLPFEMISILLLAALIGSIFVGMEKNGGKE
jgi:NADH-quinone oxidoreductase subunit J